LEELMAFLDGLPYPPIDCPACGAALHGLESSLRGMIGIYRCGAKYLPSDGDDPVPVVECSPIEAATE